MAIDKPMLQAILLTVVAGIADAVGYIIMRSEEHTSELQSHSDLHSFPTRRSSDLSMSEPEARGPEEHDPLRAAASALASSPLLATMAGPQRGAPTWRSTSRCFRPSCSPSSPGSPMPWATSS